MPRISSENRVQTVITTFDVTPGTCDEVLEALRSAYAEVISRQPGFIGGAIHVNDARTRICTYSQWRDRADFQAMLRTEEMRERNRHIHALCRSFEPVMYDVCAAFDAAPAPADG
ncbi:MAG: antibiotic biosynthesis monooxygenase [Alphaproteobacteria bacterium]|nr:MAG: antibiotic biosynthesis monooxygenase [Alphaproteobacteria bacterium]